MYSVVIVLIVLAAVLMCLIVLIQESKGGGLAAGFSNLNTMGGVRKTTDFVEKATWGLAIAMVVLSIAAAYLVPVQKSTGSVMENAPVQTTAPAALPNPTAQPEATTAAPAAETPAAPAAPAK
ncbi:MAG: preprotein translocase subunit SecG [Bacteroidaceae bacterium]|nr:preprotein translocase subunit SecG [Bacteroidaceae bacterium]MBO4592667.1 preprotein translocase subunit SecG [Bacteroidaceae bacterium]